MMTPGELQVKLDDLAGPEIADLLRQHLCDLGAISQKESMHALDLTKLRHPSVTFWSVWAGDQLAGCGALKEIEPGHGEVKSMRTVKTFLRGGVASAVLQKIISTARERGYDRLSLETGANQPFAAAHALYEKFGFKRCGPFIGYREDPNSCYYTMKLSIRQ